MVKWLHNMFTEPDNTTICPVRVVGILGTLQGLASHAYSVFWLHSAFDLQTFGIGLGATLAALGGALGFKKDSPTGKDSP